MVILLRQPEVNIGTLGHVDNGKSTLVQAFTGIWPAKHSEELRRGITIRIGYADAALYKCKHCDEPVCFCATSSCSNCGQETEFLRGISFVDCPGHHSLMVTMLAGAALMDGALLVIAADKDCPQPQDREHLAAAEIVGINQIVIVQNKIDLVDRAQNIKNYEQIVKFVENTVASEAPIIPVSAQHSANIDMLIKEIESNIPTPERELDKPPIMHIVRSFDVNLPGTDARNIVGGVVGGTITQGEVKVGDEIEISPGILVEKGGKSIYQPLTTEITSLQAGGKMVKKASSGGLVGLGTLLDPSMTKADRLVGNLIGKPSLLPTVLNDMSLDVHLFERAIGTEKQITVERIKTNEPLALNVGTAVTAGIVSSARRDIVDINLRRPVCAEEKSRVSINRRIGDSWRLIGYGRLR